MRTLRSVTLFLAAAALAACSADDPAAPAPVKTPAKAPVAGTATLELQEDATLDIALPIEGARDGIEITITAAPAHGTLVVKDAAALTYAYTPDADYFGADELAFEAVRGDSPAAQGSVKLTIKPVNDAPAVVSAVLSGTSLRTDDTLSVAVSGWSDAEDDPAGYRYAWRVNGNLVAGQSGASLTGVHFAKGNAVRVAVTPFDGSDEGAPVFSNTLTILNTPPTASAAAGALDEDTLLTGVVSGDDVDAEGLTFELTTLPAKGAVTGFDGATGAFTYVPSGNANGADWFAFRAYDGTDYSEPASFAITITAVNDAPVSTADDYATAEDTVLSVAAPGVFVNDSDPDSAFVAASVVTQPAHGQLTLNDDGSLAYTPDADYFGGDGFVYRVSDGFAWSATAMVTLTVNSVNDAPVTASLSGSLAEDGVLTDSLAGTDVENSALVFQIVSAPANGAAAMTSDATFTYTPNANYFGSDSFTFRAFDGADYSAAFTYTVTVTPVNDPPVAVADFFTIDEDAVLSLAAPGVLTNDTEIDSAELRMQIVTTPSPGAFSSAMDGSFTYTPPANFSGVATFLYYAWDLTAMSSVATTVTITVRPINDAPVASAGTLRVWQNRAFSASLRRFVTDVDDTALTFSLQSAPAQSAAHALSSTGILTYTPAAGYTGTDALTYRANDGDTDSNTATLTLEVVPWDPITMMLPASGPTGKLLQLLGSGFGAPGTVSVGGVQAALHSWTDSQIAVTVPGALTAGAHGVIVHEGGAQSVPKTYSVIPWIDGLDDYVVSTGGTVTLSGTGLGASGTVYVGGVAAVTGSWSNTSIQFTVPSLAGGPHAVSVETGGLRSNSVSLSVLGSDVWYSQQTPGGSANPIAVWTGNHMIVWGGFAGGPRLTGARYDPATDTWTAISGTGGVALQYTQGMWSGSEMLVWGGYDAGPSNAGARYNPHTDTWSPITQTGAPLGRYNHTLVWSGSEMIAWGGNTQGNVNTGGQYNPLTDAWTAMGTAGAPLSFRTEPGAAWVGNAVLYFGGSASGVNSSEGALYDPESGVWTRTATVDAPSARHAPAIVWTGAKAIVWGGGVSTFLQSNTGALYDPENDVWTPLPTAGAPSARRSHTAVWTGSDMLIWGGYYSAQSPLGDGARFNLAGNQWSAVSAANAPVARYAHAAVWTGGDLLVWGGVGAGGFLLSGARYNAAANAWSAIDGGKPNQPAGRSGSAVVYTGSEVILFGGQYGNTKVQSGAKYDPVTDAWTAIANAPNPQSQAGTAWTGTKLLVWGGYQSGITPTNQGQIFDPAGNSWTAFPLQAETPQARNGHAAVYTGGKFVVWGGYNSGYLDTGGIWDPVAETWTATSASVLNARYLMSAAAIGGKAFFFGGLNGAGDGALLDPATNTWSPAAATDAPSARYFATATPVGQGVLVWGGRAGTVATNTGAIYYPAGNTWVTVSTTGAPIGREGHGAAWSGTQLFVWGGTVDNSNTRTSTGGLYNPATGVWSLTTTVNAPPPNSPNPPIWLGDRFLIPGGMYDSNVYYYLP